MRVKLSVIAMLITAAMLLPVAARGQITAKASDIQLWSTPGYYYLSVAPTDTPALVATNNGWYVRIDPQTGTTVSVFTYNDGHPAWGESTIWASSLANGNSGDLLLSSYVGYSLNGTPLWTTTSCCDGETWSIDPSTGQGFFYSSGVQVVDLANGGQIRTVGSVPEVGFPALASSTVGYTASSYSGTVYVFDPSGMIPGSTSVSVAPGQDLYPGAVAADGSFVVTTHSVQNCNYNALFYGWIFPCPGYLARIMPDGTSAWSRAVNAITLPVIGRQGFIFVGVQLSAGGNGVPAQAAIQAYDPTNGQVQWTQNLDPGLLPSDLLLGNDGLLYAVASDFPGQLNATQGELVAIDQNNGGTPKLTVTGLTGAYGAILFNGVIYVSGRSTTAIPVATTGYDPQAPWPVRFHDNQRTANLNAPQNLGNSEIGDQIRDNMLYTQLAATNNTFSGAITAKSFFGDGSTLSGLVTSYNGQTGPVTGVSSLTAGPGISVTGTTAPTIGNSGVLSMSTVAPLSSNGGQTPTISLGTVGIANGGTGLTTGPTAPSQFLRSSAAGAWSINTLQAGDLPAGSPSYIANAGTQQNPAINLAGSGGIALNSISNGIAVAVSNQNLNGSGMYVFSKSNTAGVFQTDSGIALQATTNSGSAAFTAFSATATSPAAMLQTPTSNGIALAITNPNVGRTLTIDGAGNLTSTGSLTIQGNSAASGSVTIGAGSPGSTAIKEHVSVLFSNVTFNTKLAPAACTVWSSPVAAASDGDSIEVGIGSSLMAANIVYSAWTTTGSVWVRICNPTGAPTNVGAGNIRIDIWKH